ncbi:MAG: glycosyl transferase, partial [Pseudomonadota bacterium]|nr:glycosyl transferase [Pseudomonadota bacterium]
LLARAQAQGRKIANLEPYDGQFGFIGRLTRPIQEVPEGEPAQAWAKAHPQGLLVRYSATLTPVDRNSALYVQPFRGVLLSIWSAKEFTGCPCKTRDPAPVL